MIEIRKALPEDFCSVRDVYWAIIDDTNPYFVPKWDKNIYPTEEYIKNSIEQGLLYIALLDGKTAAAMVLNTFQPQGYEKGHWRVEAEEDEISVIHTLGVLPRLTNKGIATQMVKFAVEHAKNTGKKTIRLDVIKGNLPAFHLYEKLGFVFLERIKVFYEDTGLYDFDLFDYVI